MHTFTLVINAGRCGSTFLADLLAQLGPDELYVAHEDIPVEVSQPRTYQRAHSPERLDTVLADMQLRPYFARWQLELESRSVIETGWTSAHLAPVLAHLFAPTFRTVMLHRDPVSSALSRAVLGNYHPRTFYGDAHEVSPFDSNSIASDYQHRWAGMNPFEKCMFWWYVVYLEAREFSSLHPTVPSFDLRSDDLFSLAKVPELFDFLGLDAPALTQSEIDADHNELPQFMHETFPMADDWLAYERHPEILALAADMGSPVDADALAQAVAKYRLPPGRGPAMRHAIGYWRKRSQIAQLVGRPRHR